MKTFFFTLLCFISISVAEAQTVEATENTLTKAYEESKQWQKTLQLTAEQYQKAQKTELERLMQLEKIRTEFRYDLPKRDSAITATEAHFDAQFSNVFNAAQFAGYLELQGRNTGTTLDPPATNIAKINSVVTPNQTNSEIATPENTVTNVAATDSLKTASQTTPNQKLSVSLMAPEKAQK